MKKIYFLAYYSPHIKLFRQIMGAVPPDVKTQLKVVYSLNLASLLHSKNPPDEISLDYFENLTVPYSLKKLCARPELNTKTWKDKMMRRAIQWYHLFLSELKDADLLVMWNGLAIPLGAAATAARQLGIPVAHCENGVLPGTIAVDTCGVNWHCSLTGKDADFYRSFPYDDSDAGALHKTVWPQRPLRKTRSSKGAIDLDAGKTLPQRYLLYAMQVNEDSQIQMFSPRFRNMHESVTYVYQQLKEYNARTGDTLNLVVKEHPSDYGRVDYTDLRASMPDVVFLQSTPIRDAIKNAQALVTINSSVAVEGMISGLPIVTLGQAFYNVPGLVCHVDGEKELAEVLPSLLSEPVDNDLRMHFLCFLWKHFLVPHPDRDPSGVQKGAKRMVDIIENRLPW